MAMSRLVLAAFCISHTTAAVPEKIGLLFGSFGDTESCECVEPFFKKSLARLVEFMIPEPKFAKKFTSDIVWTASGKAVTAQYTAIDPVHCNTTFQTRSKQQAEAVGAVVRKLRPEADIRVYTGYNFVAGDGCPSGVLVADQMKQAHQDGVDKIIVVNQNGAQSSNSSIGITYEDALAYLKTVERTSWAKTLTVVGLDDFSQTAAFSQLQIQHTTNALKTSANPFAGAKPSDVCIVFASHGNPESLTKKGDPYEAQIRANYALLKQHFEALGYANVSIAWQNHGGKGQSFPTSLFPWSSPPDTDVMPLINTTTSCPNVLVTGILSFTLDMSETEFDERIDDVRMLSSKKVYVPTVFNSQPDFVKYLAGAVSGAVDMKGTVRIVHKGSSLTARSDTIVV